MTEVCVTCKAPYDAADAVPYPGNETEILCWRCGSDLFCKRIWRSLWFALCGGVFGWAIASARISSFCLLVLIASASSYTLWSTYWGWHAGGRKWFSLYRGLKETLYITAVCISLLLLLRVLAAWANGMSGAAIQQSRHALRILRISKSNPQWVQLTKP